MESKNIRIFFSKTGRAKYISHLDLYRCIQRAMRRSKLPIWQTEGFNPHTYLTFALPLSLGIDGIRESMDTKITGDITFDEVKEKLNNALPDDIRILEVTEPEFKHTEIEKSEYDVITDLDTDKFNGFIAQDSIPVEKKSKKGILTVNLKDFIEPVSIENGKITIKLPSGVNVNINPNLVFDAFIAWIGTEPEKLSITRTKIYTKSGEIFN